MTRILTVRAEAGERKLLAWTSAPRLRLRVREASGRDVAPLLAVRCLAGGVSVLLARRRGEAIPEVDCSVVFPGGDTVEVSRAASPDPRVLVVEVVGPAVVLLDELESG